MPSVEYVTETIAAVSCTLPFTCFRRGISVPHDQHMQAWDKDKKEMPGTGNVDWWVWGVSCPRPADDSGEDNHRPFRLRARG
ncbi:hypothetical protein GCM10027396_12630 [Insolitispirillum peregrinum]